MKHLSLELLAETVTAERKTMKMSQVMLSEKTGINRSLVSKLEKCHYTPSVDQLLSLSYVLGFDVNSVMSDDSETNFRLERKKLQWQEPVTSVCRWPYCSLRITM